MHVEECTIDYSKGLDLGWVLDWNDEDLHVGVVAVCLINTITEIASEEIGESPSLWMAKLHHLPLGNLPKIDIEVILHNFLDHVSSQIDNIEIISIA